MAEALLEGLAIPIGLVLVLLVLLGACTAFSLVYYGCVGWICKAADRQRFYRGLICSALLTAVSLIGLYTCLTLNSY